MALITRNTVLISCCFGFIDSGSVALLGSLVRCCSVVILDGSIAYGFLLMCLNTFEDKLTCSFSAMTKVEDHVVANLFNLV